MIQFTTPTMISMGCFFLLGLILSLSGIHYHGKNPDKYLLSHLMVLMGMYLMIFPIFISLILKALTWVK